MKKCSKCQRELDVEQFYRDHHTADRRTGKCKECTLARMRLYRAANIDRIREHDRVRSRQGHSREGSKAWKARNPEKHRAQYMVSNAIRAKRLKKEDCWCGARAEAHHPDYSKPLEVVWLCKLHHEELHHALQRQGSNNHADN